jgi:hypothetical protein
MSHTVQETVVFVNAKEFEESDRGTFEAVEGQNKIDVHKVSIIQKRWIL